MQGLEGSESEKGPKRKQLVAFTTAVQSREKYREANLPVVGTSKMLSWRVNRERKLWREM